MTKETHGGLRKGAGRKQKLVNPKRVTIWLESEQIEWLKRHGDKSKAIRELIDRERDS